MYTLHATKKLLDRIKIPVVADPPASTTGLGDWYANALMWRPQVAVFVNQTTFFPVFMPLAPSATLLHRFPDAFTRVLDAAGIDRRFIASEATELVAVTVAKTADRRVLGVLNELIFMAETRIERGGMDPADLVNLSVRVADTLVSRFTNQPTVLALLRSLSNGESRRCWRETLEADRCGRGTDRTCVVVFSEGTADRQGRIVPKQLQGRSRSVTESVP